MNVKAAIRTLWFQVLRARQHRLVILPELPPPSAHPPIFIVGCTRSGTSLLRRIIDSHSRIACPPESHFLRPLVATLSDRRSMLGLEGMGFSREVVLARTRAFAEQFFLEYATANEKPRWADKTPVYVECLDELDELFEERPQYILLYRHGLDVSFSMTTEIGGFVSKLSLPCPSRTDHQAIRAAAGYWSAQVTRMESFGARRPQRTLVVRYEDLTGSPETVVKEIMGFLGEPYEPSVLRFNAQHHDEGLEDGKVKLSGTIRPVAGRYGAWSPEQLAAAVEEAGEALVRFGYTP